MKTIVLSINGWWGVKIMLSSFQCLCFSLVNGKVLRLFVYLPRYLQATP